MSWCSSTPQIVPSRTMSPSCDFEIFSRPHSQVDSCLDIEHYCSLSKLALPSMAILQKCWENSKASKLTAKTSSIRRVFGWASHPLRKSKGELRVEKRHIDHSLRRASRSHKLRSSESMYIYVGALGCRAPAGISGTDTAYLGFRVPPDPGS